MEQAEDAGDHHEKPDDQQSSARLEEFRKSMEAKMGLRQSNLMPEIPDSSFLRTLDSSIKRNTAVIKKLKQINDEQRESLMDDLRTVNLSKFVSEAVAAICDAKLKSADIQAAVQICSLLHQRYTEFSPSLVQGLVKLFFPGKSSEDADADRNSRALKKRSTLKLLLELYFVGVVDDCGIFVSIIKDLTSVEHLKDRETTQTNLSLLASFARQGRFLLGLPLNGQDILEEFFKGLNITVDQKKLFRKALQSYYDAVTETLQSDHDSLRQLEHENAKILNAKGELNEENAASYEKLRKSFDHLYRGVTALAEALDIQPPVMPEDAHTTRVTSGEDVSSPSSGRDSSSLEALWDDEDTRAFYEGLPDLRAFVPAVLLGEAESKSNEQSSKSQEQQIDSAPETEQSTTQESIEIYAEAGGMKDDKNLKGKEKDEKDKGKSKEVEKEKAKGKDPDRKTHDKEKVISVEGNSLDSLLQRLPGCVSRDLIDQLTVEFCYLNSKSNRKKLVKTLFNVPRTSLELLPYYSRMVATLSTCMKDVSSMLLQLLEEEFNFLTNKKDQMNIETKIRNIRFIGELCKFKISPPGLIFSCLKTCLDDFTHHNIDVACNLLETCGRYLYRSPETTVRMANMLEIMMRLKKVKNLDPRHSTSVENAYYLCKPPEKSARVSKVRPPLYQYIRKLIFSDLDKSSIEHVLRQLRKLPWGECESYLLKCFLKVHKGKYSQIHLLASLTAGLSRYHDEFAVAVVDEVLEEIRLGLELNEYGMQQRRIASMRFLGELYNYELVDSSLIFDTLNLILVFGHGTSEQETLDPLEDCFRVRMVITLLETCGHYSDRGSSKRKLDRFLIHFQRYILCKGVLPLDIEFDMQDLFAVLRPNMIRYSSMEDVDAALIEIEEHEHSVSSQKENNEKYSDTGKSPLRTSSNTSVNGQSLANGIEENGDLLEELEAESGSDSGSETTGQVDHEDEGESYDDNPNDETDSQDDSDDGGGPGSDEDDEVHVRQKVAEVDPLEAADFDREFRALMQESLDSRKLELRARPTLNMMIPMNIFEGSMKDHHGREVEAESGDDTMDDGEGGRKDVPVTVLVKRGNKQQTRHMYIPRDCSLVHSTKEKEAAELEEKQDIKRLVLEYNDREEEEFNRMGQQPFGWAHSTGNRIVHRGSHTRDHGRSSGSRGRYHHHSGPGSYYGRRR
ncbi:RNA metabolism protein [Lithospermum erythrorhizon]|uniref:RNA metabolism protein n=1 Tax=Lithospermum erythrorhizon TaxID=34254 RepID=A0AAV3NMM3_LITER